MRILFVSALFLVTFVNSARVARDEVYNYPQMLENARSVLRNSRNVSKSVLLEASQVLNELSKVIDIYNVFKTINAVSFYVNGDIPAEPTTISSSNRTTSILNTTPCVVHHNNNTTQHVVNNIHCVVNSTGTPNVTPSSWPKPSEKCSNDTRNIFPAVIERKDWALKMLDAAGKPPPGLMNFRLNWMGNYDECVGIKTESYNGQFCTVTLLIMSITNPLTQQKGVPVKIGLCMPDTCSEQDQMLLLNSVMSNIAKDQVYITEVKCQKPNRPYDTKAKIVLGVLGCLIGLMGIATTYDLVIRHISKQRKHTEDKYESQIDVEGGHTNIKYEPDLKDESTIKQDRIATVHNGESGLNNGTMDSQKSIQNPPSNQNATSNQTQYKPGVGGQLLQSFSVYSNAIKILSTRQGEGALTAINGVRFISMTWVILGHTYAFGFLIGGIGNIGEIYTKFISRKSFMAVINAEVSVDTFFALSGTLLTYLVLKQLKKGKGNLNWFMFYFHRFWRLTPPYMLIIMVNITLFPYLGSGPLWPKDGTEKNYCKDSWWYNLLYINNFQAGTDECFAHSWYLANDMQFFIISPLIILPLFFSKVGGTIVTALFLLGTTIAAGVVSSQLDLDISTSGRNGGLYFDYFYVRPYCRMGPYLVGMYTGYMLYKTKCKYSIDLVTLACTVLYGVYDDFNGKPMSTDVAALYNALHKTAWGASICWVIFACATGNGGFINTFLSWKVFVPLSRLTYCAYLVHPIVQYYYYLSRKELQYWDDHEIIYEYLAHVGMAYAAAFIASLAFESPMMGLEKVVFKRGGK